MMLFKMLASFKYYLDSFCKAFSLYFFTYYVDNLKYKLWSAVYRKNSPAHENMHIETFHKMLKHNYLETRKNQRLDHLIEVLFRIDLDKKFDQERKLVFGKISHHHSELHLRPAAFSFLLTIVLFHLFFLCVCHS